MRPFEAEGRAPMPLFSPEPPKDTARWRFAVVAARFNDEHTEPLLAGALARLRERGVGEVDVARVAGSFEVPAAAKKLAATGRYRAVVCLGVLIRGETPHFDHIAHACADGISQVALETGVPCAFGVLTCETEDQVRARLGGPFGHKGAEAADAALDMAVLFDAIDRGRLA
jgi:6,7-dimethyl-8-ribityllumazine synthase